MRKFLFRQKAQALVELVMVLMLFALFITGIIQLTYIGHGWLKLHQLARRTAWHGNYYNNNITGSTFGNHRFGTLKEQLDYIAGEFEYEIPLDKITGNRDKGFVYEVIGTVKSIGYFKLVWPNGIKLKTTSTVISSPFKGNLGRPIVDRARRQGKNITPQLIEYILEKLNLSF